MRSCQVGFSVFLLLALLDIHSAAGQSVLSPPAGVIPDTTYGEVDYELGVLALDGSRTRLSNYQDRVVFINFWATWCAPCVSELPSIEALRGRLEGADVDVLLISIDDDLDEVREFLQQQRVVERQVYLRDWKGSGRPFQRGVVPSTYIVSRSGKVVYRHVGAADWDSEVVAAFLRTLTEE